MKRLLAILISLCILLSCIPGTVIALEAEEGTLPVQQTEPAVEQTEPVTETEPVEELAQVELPTEAVLLESEGHTHHACSCVITGDTACTHEGDALQWQAWDGKSTITANGNYYLTGDVTLTAAIGLYGDINLCLHGHTISADNSKLTKHMIQVGHGTLSSHVTIMDCRTKLENGQVVYEGGITGGKGANGSGGAIQLGHVNLASSLELIGVQISNSQETYNTNKTPANNEQYGGGAIHVRNGSLNTNYSRFSGNQATSAVGTAKYGCGGAISVYLGSVTAKNTEFTGNQAVSKGGAIFLRPNSGATASLQGCKLTGNTADSYGAAVYVGKGCSLSATNTTFTGNTVGKNGVIYAEAATVTFSGVTMTGNTGGLFVGSDFATVTLSGNTQVLNNANAKGTGAENVYFNKNKTLYLGDLGEKADIRVATKDLDETCAFLAKGTGFNADAWTDSVHWLTYDNLDATIRYSKAEDKFYLVAHSHGVCSCGVSGADCTHDQQQWQAWTDPSSLPNDGSKNYYLATDVKLSAKQNILNDVTLCLNGHTITAADGYSGTLFQAGTGSQAVSMTLMNCKSSGGISGAGSAGGGGAVQVGSGSNTSSFKVLGVAFTGNTEAMGNQNYGGGAIHVRNGNVTLEYATFEGNKATGVKDNASVGAGGAISIYLGSVSASNTTFTGNEATQGGAVYLRPESGASLTLKNCSFTGNISGDSGSAVYVGKDCFLTAEDTTFHQNKATGNATVFIGASTDGVSFTGGSFTGNSAAYGSALYVSANSLVTIEKTTFTGNTATKNGTILLAGAPVVLTDVVMKENNGGFYASSSTAKLTVNGSTQIFGNTGEDLHFKNNIKLYVGSVTQDTQIHVTTGTPVADDPDVFLALAQGASLEDMEITGIYYRSSVGLRNVGYKAGDTQFYFSDTQTHCVCGDGQDANCDHGVITWTPWYGEDSLPVDAGYYYLVNDVTMAAGAEIKTADAQVYLCLNGKTVTAPEEGAVYIVSGSGAKLTITDCTAKTENEQYLSGKITGATASAITMKTGTQLDLFEGSICNNPTNGGGGAVALQKTPCTFNMYGGEISGNTATSGGGVYVAADCTMNLYGGKISGNTATNNFGGGIRSFGTLNLYGGEISGNTAAQRGGGIYQEGAASVGLYQAGLITGNIVAETGDQGGGLYVAGGNATLSGVVITENLVPAQGGGAGVVAGAKAVVNMTAGEISGHTAKIGGGVTVQGGAKFTLSGGTIENNKATSDENGKGGEGGGIYVAKNSYLTIAGGNIQNNTAAMDGGGLIAHDGSVVTITGGYIQSNLAQTGNGGGVYVANSQLDLKGGYILKNQTATESGAGVSTSGKCKVTMSGTFISENVAAKNAGGILVAGAGSEFVFTGGTISHNQAAKNGGGVFISKDVAMDMRGGIVKYNSAKDGAGLCIYFGEAELSGGNVSYNSAENSGGGMLVTETSSATISGDVLFNNNKAITGAGVCVSKTSKLSMDGGILEANAATKYGAGVALQNQSEFTFSGGQIRGNTAESGGGILVNSGSKLSLKGGASVTGNKAAKGYGGGIAAASSSNPRVSVTISGGTVSGNSAKKTGGGIHIAKGNLTMTGGSIRGNTSVDSGAGLYIKESTADLIGGSISGNSTQKTGGGVATTLGATLNLKGTTISGNSAMAEGGCGGGVILMGQGSVMNFSSGLITQNKVAKSGAGLYISKNTTLNMSGGTISENEAGESGGGIILGLCTTNITGGLVTKNVSGGTGGGISNSGKCLVNISGMTISENVAEKAGGGLVIVTRDSVLNLSDSIIENNISKTNNGGGLYQSRYVIANLSNVTIRGNTVGKKGGGLYLAGHEATLENVTIEGNESVENGGGLLLETWTKLTADGLEVHDNISGKHGGGLYLTSGTATKLSNATFTGNQAAERGAAIWAGADLSMHNLKATGNTSGKLGTVYLADSKYDGESYVAAVYTMSGDMYIYDNPGEGKDLYLSGVSCLSIQAPGLGKDSKIGINLKEGLLTDKVYGEYDYEGGNLEYLITYGDRSVTDPEELPVEEIPVEETQATEEATQPEEKEQGGSSVGLIAAAAAALVAILVLIILLLKRKKNKKG